MVDFQIVKIYSDSNGKPDAEVANAAFTGPSNPHNQDAVYTCSGSGCALSASTTYHLHLFPGRKPGLLSLEKHGFGQRGQRAVHRRLVNRERRTPEGKQQ